MTETSEPHPSDEHLSAHLDGEVPEVASHLSGCEQCAEQFALLREARHLVASPVEELGEATDSALIGNAMGAYGRQRPSVVQVSRPGRARGGNLTSPIVRAAAAVLVLGAVGGGVALYHHETTNHATASAAAAVNGQKAAAAAAQAQAHAAQQAARHGKVAQTPGRLASARGPFASAVVQLRPLREDVPGRCVRSGSTLPDGGVQVTAPATTVDHGEVSCLLFGRIVVEAWRGARIRIAQPSAATDAFSLPLTRDAAQVLEHAGVPEVTGQRIHLTVPLMRGWKVAALQDNSFVGTVSLVLVHQDAPTTSYSALVVGVSPRAAQALVRELSG